MKGSFDKARDGQTLIEVLLALGTAVVVLSATVVAVLAALNNAQFSKNQNIATQYAQQGMEVMRKMRNSNWSEFNTLCAAGAICSYCLGEGDTFLDSDDGRSGSVPNGCSRTGRPSPNPNIRDIYVRQVDIEEDVSKCGNDVIKVTVSASWASNKCTDTSNLYCHSVKLVSCLGRP